MQKFFAGILDNKPALIAEFVLLFLAAPLFAALIMPPQYMFVMLWSWTALGLFLLYTTPHFDWHDLKGKIGKKEIKSAILFAVVTLIATLLITYWIFPERLFGFIREAPIAWLMVMLLYPLLSALPQELIFRVLYFERFKSILPKRVEPFLNAALFSFAHLLYWNFWVFLLTFVGGYIFARAYREGNFALAVLLHAIGGNMIFTSGMGILFYSGNV